MRRVVLILLDAFRWDFTERTSAFRELAASSIITGNLEEPFGFCPRAAYFSGSGLAEQGFSHMWGRSPSQSPFSWLNFVDKKNLDGLAAKGQSQHLLQYLKSRLDSLSNPYVRRYGHIPAVPTKRLKNFFLQEQASPWDSSYPLSSIFKILDDSGREWMEVSWPFDGEKTDAQVMEDFDRRVTSTQDFIFLHFTELDSLGHRFGPGSLEVTECLVRLSKIVEHIIGCSAFIEEPPVFIIFGDHGMIPVLHGVNIIERIEEVIKRYDLDLDYFVDSTMVRFWGRECSLAKIKSEIPDNERIFFVDESHFVTLGLKEISKTNGELFLIARPGVVFQPNYFDSSEVITIKGMHGYMPEVRDNKGAFLIFDPRHRPQTAHRGLLDFKAKYIFELLNTLLFSERDYCEEINQKLLNGNPSVSRSLQPSDPHHYDTLLGRLIEENVDKSVLDSLYLMGSFARGDLPKNLSAGTPLNDLDLGFSGDTPNSGSLINRVPLIESLNVKYVDFGPIRTQDIPRLHPCRLADYDFVDHARRFDSSSKSFKRDNFHFILSPSAISQTEVVNLIINRQAGYLSALFNLSTIPRTDIESQAAKLIIGFADMFLISIGDYSPKNDVKASRTRDFSHFFTDDFRSALVDAINFKSGQISRMPSRALEPTFLLSMKTDLQNRLDAFGVNPFAQMIEFVDEKKCPWVDGFSEPNFGLFLFNDGVRETSNWRGRLYSSLNIMFDGLNLSPLDRKYKIIRELGKAFEMRTFVNDQPLESRILKAWYEIKS